MKLKINSVNPGATRTAMRAQAMPGEDPETLPTPQSVAEKIVKLADPNLEVSGKLLMCDRIASSTIICRADFGPPALPICKAGSMYLLINVSRLAICWLFFSGHFSPLRPLCHVLPNLVRVPFAIGELMIKDHQRFIIISGGPGSGKSTLIDALERQGFPALWRLDVPSFRIRSPSAEMRCPGVIARFCGAYAFMGNALAHDGGTTAWDGPLRPRCS